MPAETFTINMLFDFYGALLSPRQQQFVRLYREENWSLSEIAAEFDLSRQGVYASVKKAEEILAQYEEKLGLVARFRRSEEVLQRMDCRIAEILEEHRGNEKITGPLEEVRRIAWTLGE